MLNLENREKIMKNTTFIKMLMTLGVAMLLNACTGGSGGGADANQTTPVAQGDNPATATGTAVQGGSNYIEVKVNLKDLDGIDLYGETGNPAPYIEVDGVNHPISLSSIPEEHITRNADGIIIAVIDWQVVAPLPSNYGTNARVIMWSLNTESGEFEQKVSQDFYMHTAQEAPKPDPTPTPNTPPKWTASSYDTGKTIEDSTDSTQTIMDLKPVSSDADGDAITYSIVSVNVPGQQTEWNNSISISSGILVVQNLKTNDPETNGNVSVVVKASAKGGSANTTISFTFRNVQ